MKFSFFDSFVPLLANFKKYSNRYINDYNITSPFELNYDYDNTKISSDNLPYHKQQASTKIDENFDVLYPDPEDIKTRMTEHHEETVVKICKLNEYSIFIGIIISVLPALISMGFPFSPNP